MTPERLQKVLARTGIASRRAVEQMIREGRVTIDGRVAELGERVDLETQAVKVDDRRILPSSKVRHYVLVNKPGGYVSTVSDPEGRPTVLDLVPQRLRHGLVPVGRLDYATEGLLLLTDDGELAHRVAHPRFGCKKTYEVKVKGRPDEAAITKLRGGIQLFGKRTAPARITPRGPHLGARGSVENSWWVVTLSEGRSRQIREMFHRVGHPVTRLRRVAIGPVSDPQLPRGAWRELSAEEVDLLRGKTEAAPSAARRAKWAKPKKRAKPKPPPKAGRPARPAKKGAKR